MQELSDDAGAARSARRLRSSEVARIFVEGHHGLPVCDARHHVVGVVSAGDVLYKEHDPLDKGRRRRPWWPRGRRRSS